MKPSPRSGITKKKRYGSAVLQAIKKNFSLDSSLPDEGTAVVLQATKKNFSLDIRSLSLFRVFISLILIIDFLFTRLPYFDLFYTERGLLPLKSFLKSGSFWAETSSLNFLFSGYGYQIFLFIAAVVFFLMLLVGYKTRWAILGAWILNASFQSRNFLIINSGDVLLCLILFWSLCLPLGKYFSMDNALYNHKVKKNCIFSVNSFAFIFQILFVYFFTYLLKTDDVWKNGQAVYYALMLDNFRTVWGDILLQYPGIMQALSYITYYFIEGLVPFLFVFFGVWWRFRVTLIFFMCCFHLSLWLFLHLGCFQWICMAVWLALLPSEFWERAKKLLPGRENKLRVYYDRRCSFCKKSVFLIKTFLILPHVSFFEGQSDQRAFSEMEKRNSWLVFDSKTGWHGRWQAWTVLISYSPLLFYLAPFCRMKMVSALGDWLYGKVAGNRKTLGFLLPPLGVEKRTYRNKTLSVLLFFFFFFCFLYAAAWNIRTTDFDHYSKYMSTKWNKFGAFLHLHQYWNMFAPKPFDNSGWIILSAVKRDTGEKIDLWRQGQALDMKKPHRYDMSFPVFRFRKMMENLVSQEFRGYSKNYLIYLCNKWNKKQEGFSIKNIEFIYMKHKTPPPGETTKKLTPAPVSIRKQRCFPHKSG